MTRVDFGRAAGDYARHRQGFPPRLFEALAARGIGAPAQRILDLGTGTGGLARGLARAGAAVTGLDISEALIDAARGLDAAAGVSVAYVVAPAESTGLDDNSFDVVTAGQCWHWFDRPRAAREAARVLKDGGALVIAHYDWLPRAGSVVAATEALILKHNPAWAFAGGDGVYPAWLDDMAAAFWSLESFGFDEDALYTHEAWRGRVRASAGVAASLPAEAVARFDDELAALLARDFPDDPLHVPHRVFVATGLKPSYVGDDGR